MKVQRAGLAISIFSAAALLAYTLLQQATSPPPQQTTDSPGASSFKEDAEYWFKHTIESDPLVRAAATDEQRVNAIREWAYNAIPRASEICLFESGMEYREPYEILRLANTTGRGFLCGGTAVVMANIYSLMGYQSGAYNAGEVNSKSTHVVTLVQLPSGKVSLQDAYFNVHLAGRDGNLADFGDFLADLKRGDSSSYQFIQGPKTCKPLVDTEEGWKVLELLAEYPYGKTLNQHHGRAMRCHEFSLDAFLKTTPSFQEAISKATGRDGIEYLFTLPLGASGIASRYISCRSVGDCDLAEEAK